MAKKPEFVPFATMLSYTRSINPTRGAWYNLYGPDQKLTPVEVVTSSFSGSISNYIEPSKYNSGRGTNIDAVNLQTGDTCNLDVNAKGFVFHFGLSIVASSSQPDGCNSLETRSLLQQFSRSFGANYIKLARLYLLSLVSGSVLWRNISAIDKTMNIKVRRRGDVEDSLVICIDKLANISMEERNILVPSVVLPELSTISFDDLVHMTAEALSDKTQPLSLSIDIAGYLPGGHEIYPSQEFVPADINEKRSRVLDTYPVRLDDGRIINAAATHPQKIGNAIRQIDIWHSELNTYGPLPVEMYGFSRTFGVAVRTSSKGDDVDFYSLLNTRTITKMIERLNELAQQPFDRAFIPEAEIDRHILFFMACLIRGGVFGRKGD